MKEILILILIIFLILIEGCSTVGYGVRKKIHEEDTFIRDEIEINSKNKIPDQSEVMDELKCISFQAKQNSRVLVSFNDQQIEGLLMGMESDSVLIRNVAISSDTLDHLIPINEIHNIRIIKKSKGNYFLLGGIGGALTFGLIGYLGGDSKSDGIVYFSAEDNAKCGALIGLVIGGLLGLIMEFDARVGKKHDLSDLHYFQKIQVIKKLSGYKN